MDELKREITISNAYNKFAKTVLAMILPQLPQFIGKKIFLADGSRAKLFTANFYGREDLKIEGMHVSVQNCYLHEKYKKLQLSLRISCNGGSYEVKPTTGWTKYVGVDFELGTCNDGQTLDSVDTLENIVKMYGLDNVIDFNEEMQKIKTYKELEKQAEEAKRKIKVGAEYYKYL